MINPTIKATTIDPPPGFLLKESGPDGVIRIEFKRLDFRSAEKILLILVTISSITIFSVFHDSLLIGIFPNVSMLPGLVMMLLFCGFFYFAIFGFFYSRVKGFVIIQLSNDDLIIKKRVFFKDVVFKCRKSDIKFIRQVIVNGPDEDIDGNVSFIRYDGGNSFEDWKLASHWGLHYGLWIKAVDNFLVLDYEEKDRVDWLGLVISEWSEKPFYMSKFHD